MTKKKELEIVATKTKPLTSMPVLMAAIGQIGRNSVKLEAQIQFVAVQCIAQSIVHRNSTPARELYENLPKGYRHDALAAFFEKFGNLAYAAPAGSTKKTIVFYDVEKMSTKGEKREWTQAWELECEMFMWTGGTVKKEPKSVYDVESDIAAVLDRLTKVASDPTKTLKHKDLLDKMVSAYKAYVFESHGGANIAAEAIGADASHTVKFNNSMRSVNSLDAIRELVENAETEVLITEQTAKAA